MVSPCTIELTVYVWKLLEVSESTLTDNPSVAESAEVLSVLSHRNGEVHTIGNTQEPVVGLCECSVGAREFPVDLVLVRSQIGFARCLSAFNSP